jgi:hypothetical protein
VVQLYPRALGSLFIDSYDSQGLRWKYSNPPPHGCVWRSGGAEPYILDFGTRWKLSGSASRSSAGISENTITLKIMDLVILMEFQVFDSSSAPRTSV